MRQTPWTRRLWIHLLSSKHFILVETQPIKLFTSSLHQSDNFNFSTTWDYLAIRPFHLARKSFRPDYRKAMLEVRKRKRKRKRLYIFALLIFGNIKARSIWQDWGNKVNRLTDTSDLTVIRFNQVIKVWTNMSVCLHGTPCHIQPHLHLTIIFLLSQVRLCNTARKHTSVLSTLLFMKPWLLIFYRIKAPGMSTACTFVCFWW